ncbi:MAG: Mut7-C RNAse domain-containing protein [Conexivisphaerales archaeon]
MKRPPSLLVDGMLGSLARKLRLYGFDTLYFDDKDDYDLMVIAKNEERVLVSSDRALISSARAKGIEAVEILGKNDVERLSEVFTYIKHNPVLKPENSRCPVCNGEILQAEKDKLAGKVPPAILARYDRFFSCSSCGKVYWEGGHWKRLSNMNLQLSSMMGMNANV